MAHKTHLSGSHMRVTSPFVRFARWTVRRPVQFWLLALIVFIVARSACWLFPFDSDHWIFFYLGRDWLVEGGKLYVSAWDHKPPIIYLLNGIMALLFHENLLLHRVFLTALTVLDTWLFYLLAKRLWPRLLSVLPEKLPASQLEPIAAARTSLLLYVFLRNLSQLTNSGNNTEAFGIIFAEILVLAFLRFWRNEKTGLLVLAGTGAGLLFWIKGNFILLPAVLGFLLLWHGRKHLGRLALWVLAYVLPMLVITGLIVGYFIQVGSFQEFWIASFSFSAAYARSAWAGGVSSSPWLIIITLLFLVPGLCCCLLALRDVRAWLKESEPRTLLCLFIASLALILLVGTFSPYYVLILLPWLVPIVVYALFCLTDAHLWLQRLVVILGLGLLVVHLGISTRQLLNGITGYVKQDATEQQAAAAYVRANTSETDLIYANQYGATFYILADRRSATRYLSASWPLLDWRDNYGFNLDETILSEFEAHPPVFVIQNDATANLYAQNKPLAEYLSAHYHLVESFGHTHVLKRNE